MNRRDYEDAMVRELESWPGAEVQFVNPTGKGHPKAKFTFGGKMMSLPYPSTPSDSAFGIHSKLGDVRRALKKMGAVRDKPEPSKEEDEAPYRKPNNGAAQRQPIRVSEPVPPEHDLAEKLVFAGAATAEQAMGAKDPGSLFAVREGTEGTQASPSDHALKVVSAATTPWVADVDDAAAQLRAEFEARVAGIVDGIYFGLPADVYHAVPRLSSSGIQKLDVSPGTFWRKSWLDPDRPAVDEDENIWQILGRAYHTARLEPHLFEQLYCRKLDKSEAPKGTVFTGKDMEKALEDLGYKKSGSVAEQAERLADAGYPVELIWPLRQQIWERERGTRTPLDPKQYDQMITDRDRISKNSQIGPLLSGGEAEVSIFWTDEYGIEMKSRVDYLTRDWWVDFKTFDNSKGKNLNQALADAVRYNRYYIQASVYREAIEQVRVNSLPIIEAQTDDQRALIAAMQIKPAELRCWYVFQEKGGIPNLLAREFPFYSVPWTTIFNEQITDDEDRRLAVRAATNQRTDIFRKGEFDTLNAKKLFVLYSSVYQPGEPWFPIDSIGTFSDEDFHPYWLVGDMR